MTTFAKILIGALLAVAWNHITDHDWVGLIGDVVVIALAVWVALPDRSPMRSLSDVVTDGLWPMFNEQVNWLVTSPYPRQVLGKIEPRWCEHRDAHNPHTWITPMGIGEVCAGVGHRKGRGAVKDVHDQALGKLDTGS